MTPLPDQDALFIRHRSMLFTIAYQILGSRADAEDVVQETYLRWAAVDGATVQNARAYLATAVTRTALNQVRTLARRREDYPGPWLPEPLMSDAESPEQQLLVKEQLSYALSVVLQQGTPEQRAVFMLHDVFAVPYPTIAEAMGKSQASVRQIAHRARSRLDAAFGTSTTAATDQNSAEVLDVFLAAVATGNVKALIDVLAPDAVLLSDGGGRVIAARRPIVGAEAIAGFLLKIAGTPAPEMRVQITTLNGGPGVLVHASDRVDLALAIAVDDRRRITGVYLVRNPEKLGAAPVRPRAVAT